ncbi:branched-chain amino acid ABC transporter permease [Paraburkholderia sp. MM5384-R2]|uniref:branched-chain amino acid ABC transporter permease n=1 Tax=Paraburkholderia sp. MM5384-R2 TaxID=2723097 RepID=UPI00161504B3|nr:branched-chain amino acid ABC transporter permease [Paraburkholderia sp. MM5384-R2]MBB5502007.1 branched-chain amino acid transport system permease protein [Paraburkholderia sp. MM5384-R2]
MSGMISYLVFFLIQASIFAVVCLGLNLQWGYTGLFNIGISGFFLVGAYAFAILCGPPYDTHLGGFGLPYVVGLAGALCAAAMVGFIVGIPTLRLREDYLAIVTIGIGSILQLISLNASSLTGGSRGASSIPRLLPGLFQSVLGVNLLMLGFMAVLVLIIYRALEAMVRSPWGRVLKAIREDDTAASSLGKNPFLFRLQSFVIGSALMGLGGALYASFIGFISPEDFLPVFTFQIWTMLIVGGSGNNKGAILGAVLMWAVWTLSGSAAQAALPVHLQVKGGAAQIMLIGLVLMLTLIFRPRGLVGEEATVSREAHVLPRKPE